MFTYIERDFRCAAKVLRIHPYMGICGSVVRITNLHVVAMHRFVTCNGAGLHRVNLALQAPVPP